VEKLKKTSMLFQSPKGNSHSCIGLWVSEAMQNRVWAEVRSTVSRYPPIDDQAQGRAWERRNRRAPHAAKIFNHLIFYSFLYRTDLSS